MTRFLPLKKINTLPSSLVIAAFFWRRDCTPLVSSLYVNRGSATLLPRLGSLPLAERESKLLPGEKRKKRRDFV